MDKNVSRCLDNLKNSSETHRDWDRWVRDHLDGLLLFTRRRTACEEDAQDVVQQSLAEAWRRGVPELALVFTIIRRRAIDLGRSRSSRDAQRTEIKLRMEPGWLDGEAETRDTAAFIAARISALPAAQQEALELHLWSGLTFREIGAITGVSTHTAASRFKAAIAKLRPALQELDLNFAHETH